MIYFHDYNKKINEENIKIFSSFDDMKQYISKEYNTKEIKLEPNYSIYGADDIVIGDHGYVLGFCGDYKDE